MYQFMFFQIVRISSCYVGHTRTCFKVTVEYYRRFKLRIVGAESGMHEYSQKMFKSHLRLEANR